LAIGKNYQVSVRKPLVRRSGIHGIPYTLLSALSNTADEINTMAQLRNFTYEEITHGQRASYSREVTEREVQLFAAVSGDVNPVHLDAAYAATTRFGERIAHGMLTGAFVSAAIALELPGPGTIYLGQDLRFRLPVKLGDVITVKLEVTDKRDRRRMVTLDCQVLNQHDKLVASGTAEVMAPSESICIERPPLPQVRVEPPTG
jgi:acyl dehydratase